MLRHLADTAAWAPSVYFDAENHEDQAWKWKKMLREAADNIQAPIAVQEKFDNMEYANGPEKYSELLKFSWKTHTKADYDTYERDYKLARVKERKGWKFIAENIDGLWD